MFILMLDSYFSHAMILYTIQGSPEVHFFFLHDIFYERFFFFDKIVKLTNSLVEPRT